jgi:hypothetical protein
LKKDKIIKTFKYPNNMKYPIKYTYLGFYLNSLVDSGEFISLSEIKIEISKRTVLSFLKSKYEDKLI